VWVCESENEPPRLERRRGNTQRISCVVLDLPACCLHQQQQPRTKSSYISSRRAPSIWYRTLSFGYYSESHTPPQKRASEQAQRGAYRFKELGSIDTVLPADRLLILPTRTEKQRTSSKGNNNAAERD